MFTPNAAMKDFLFEQSQPLNERAIALVDQAKSMMKQRFIHGFHQLVAVGIDENGRDHVGVQQDVPIGQASTCAEVVAIAKAVDRSVTLKLLVTVHHKRPDQEGDLVHVVTPCGLCRERLMHFFPECQIIVWLKGELRVLPISLLLPLPYKTKVRNGDGKKPATAIFDDH
jgi:cytidine deaminase